MERKEYPKIINPYKEIILQTGKTVFILLTHEVKWFIITVTACLVYDIHILINVCTKLWNWTWYKISVVIHNNVFC